MFSSDLTGRENFALEILARMELDKKWQWKILGTNEIYFHLTGYDDTQNCQIWGTESPLETQPVSHHSTKVTMCCGLKASFIIRPYIFFKETGALDPVTFIVTGLHYECLLCNHVIPALQRPTSGRVVALKTGRREVPGSNP